MCTRQGIVLIVVQQFQLTKAIHKSLKIFLWVFILKKEEEKRFGCSFLSCVFQLVSCYEDSGFKQFKVSVDL